MPTDLDKEQNDHPQTENFLFSTLALEKAARSNFQNRPLVQYPEMETIDHKKKRIARACATLSGSASRCPSVLHQRQKQAPKRKTRHVHRFRNGSVLLPVQVPLLCSFWKKQSHQASSILHQNPQSAARSCCPLALDRSPQYLCTRDCGQSDAPWPHRL